MKRIAWIITTGGVLLVSAYLGFPAFFSYLVARERREPEVQRMKLSDVGRPPTGYLQPGLSFIQDLDEVRFLYLRSFDPEIEITVSRRDLPKGKLPLLRAVIFQRQKPENEQYTTSEKEISEQVFAEFATLAALRKRGHGGFARVVCG